MPENKQTQLEAFDKMMTLLRIPSSEQFRYRKGFEQLMDSGWPSKYVDLPMIERHHLGLVPRYEGFHTFLQYQRLIQKEEASKMKMEMYVKELLLDDGVNLSSISAYVTAWKWAEMGKPEIPAATHEAYETYANRVYRLLEKIPFKK